MGCGVEVDRDLNAAINILAVSYTERPNAYEESISPQLAEAASMKQEPNTIKRMT